MHLDDLFPLLEGAQLTLDDLQRALALKQTGLPWAAVAQRFGTTEGSLKVRVQRMKNGAFKNTAVVRANQNSQIEKMVEDGMTVSQIAKALGSSYTNMYIRLQNMGLDREMRDEIKADRSKLN